MKKIYCIILIITLIIACTGCKEENNNIDLNALYEKNGELASYYFFGWGTDEIKYELIIFEPENATIFETAQFGELFTDDVEKILYAKYELKTINPYVIAVQYKSVDQAKESWLLSRSLYMQYENIVAAKMSGTYMLLYGNYIENDGYFLTLDGEVLLFDNLCYERINMIIPNGVKSIATGGFISNTVKTIKCNSELEIIHGNAFDFMISLEKIEFNDGLKEIGGFCFINHNLGYVVIPESVEKIGYQAFSNLNIYCEVEAKPSGWEYGFAGDNCKVYWKGKWEYVNGVPQPISNKLK